MARLLGHRPHRRLLRQARPFRAVVEATDSYEWLLGRIEPMACRVVLAHPGKLRILAESTMKSDEFDARVLAEFLALDMIPQAYRPTPGLRQHRALVRRQFLIRRRTQARNKVRRILSDSNADRRGPLQQEGHPGPGGGASGHEADRFIVEQLLGQLRAVEEQAAETRRRLREFASSGPEREREHRRAPRGVPGVGEVTAEVVPAEEGRAA
jgi:transposase